MSEPSGRRPNQIDLYMLGRGKVVFDARPEKNQATILFVGGKDAFSLILDRHSLLKLADVVIEALDAMAADSATVSGLAWHLADAATSTTTSAEVDLSTPVPGTNAE